MENKRKNTGAVILIFGGAALSSYATRIDPDNFRAVDIVLLCCIGIFIGCGVYVMIRNRKKVD